MNTLFRSALLLGLVSLAACGTPSSQSPFNLSGSSWTLVAYHPANGAEIRPAHADQYRLQFQPDGRLLAQIDCNRGSGSWQTTGQPGGLRLGPLALTRMMCAPAPLTAQLPLAIETVQSYRLVDGRLQLQSDAGSYLWQRAHP